MPSLQYLIPYRYNDQFEVKSISGYYVASVQTPSTLSTSVEQMYNLMLEEMTVECKDSPGIKTGFIGEVGSTWPIHGV